MSEMDNILLDLDTAAERIRSIGTRIGHLAETIGTNGVPSQGAVPPSRQDISEPTSFLSRLNNRNSSLLRDIADVISIIEDFESRIYDNGPAPSKVAYAGSGGVGSTGR